MAHGRITNQEIEIMDALYESGINIIHYEPPLIHTLILQEGLYYRDVETIKKFRSSKIRKALDINEKNVYDFTILHESINEEKIKNIIELLRDGADPFIKCESENALELAERMYNDYETNHRRYIVKIFRYIMIENGKIENIFYDRTDKLKINRL